MGGLQSCGVLFVAEFLDRLSVTVVYRRAEASPAK